MRICKKHILVSFLYTINNHTLNLKNKTLHQIQHFEHHNHNDEAVK